MRMPKAARVAFGGEMRFVPSMAQAYLLSPIRKFSAGAPLSKARSNGRPTEAPWRGTPPLQPAVSTISNSNP
jgi:hypothetical protein